jgi:hypothetical protein
MEWKRSCSQKRLTDDNQGKAGMETSDSVSLPWLTCVDGGLTQRVTRARFFAISFFLNGGSTTICVCACMAKAIFNGEGERH